MIMRNIIFLALLTGLALCITGPGSYGQSPENKPQPPEVTEQKKALGKERSELEIPEELLLRACEHVGFGQKTLGFTTEQIESNSGKAFRLESTPKLLSDITKLPRFSGRMADILLENPDNFSRSVALGFSLLTSPSGRGVSAPQKGWGVGWIPEDADITQTFNALIENARQKGI